MESGNRRQVQSSALKNPQISEIEFPSKTQSLKIPKNVSCGIFVTLKINLNSLHSQIPFKYEDERTKVNWNWKK